jgi:uncharacterized protein (TIGR02646 family)
MRRIDKRPQEPRALLEYRKCGGKSYDDFPHKDTLREALVEDQGALCCYCMSRIEIDLGRMKIEHYRCQRLHPEQQIQWRNLLGSCTGGEGKPPRAQTCDTRKGDEEITVDPLSKNVSRLHYQPDGRITSSDPEVQRDLDERLNLNSEVLKGNRRAALEGYRRALDVKLGPAKSWRRQALEGELARLREEKPLQELLGVLEYWLGKLIAKR